MSCIKYAWQPYTKNVMKFSDDCLSERERCAKAAALRQADASTKRLLEIMYTHENGSMNAAADAIGLDIRDAQRLHKKFMFCLAHELGIVKHCK